MRIKPPTTPLLFSAETRIERIEARCIEIQCVSPFVDVICSKLNAAGIGCNVTPDVITSRTFFSDCIIEVGESVGIPEVMKHVGAAFDLQELDWFVAMESDVCVVLVTPKFSICR